MLALQGTTPEEASHGVLGNVTQSNQEISPFTLFFSNGSLQELRDFSLASIL